jgi:transposase-like protein
LSISTSNICPSCAPQTARPANDSSYVAIDPGSRFVHLAVYDAENAANAVAFLKAARKAFPFRITHVLTDRKSCFTADDIERASAKVKIIHRTT